MNQHDKGKLVSAQQAMEEFLMEMLPAQSDLPERLQANSPGSSVPVTASSRVGQSLDAQSRVGAAKSDNQSGQQTALKEPMSLQTKLLKARLASVMESARTVARQKKVQSKAFDEPAAPAPAAAPAPEFLPTESHPAEAALTASPIIDQPRPIAVKADIARVSVPFVPPGPWLDCGRPQWAGGSFQILLFTVAGLKMAVPLVSLGSINPLVGNLTPLVGRAKWFIGLMPVHQQNVRVVDTALWAMPDRYREGIRENYKYAIALADSDWGLACDDVAQAITLAPEKVRWRTQRSKRPWLAGTVIEHMCALVDADILGYQLSQSQQAK
ncbi:MAG: chemotaxis protein CheW [Gammaproteobacteria bacterium]|nr:MAG: chemotaxis protein CheW [Gammaproteobacteria bacterium]